MNVIIGFLTGVAASMGLGGGFILIIWLTLFMGVPQAQAQGINLVFFLPVALFSTIIHAKNKLISRKVLPFAVLAGVIGAAAGSFVSLFLPDEALGRIFGGLIILAGAKEIFHRDKKQEQGVTDSN